MSYAYNQLAIGDCGHTVMVWPQFSGPNGKNPRVFCDTCAREQYGIADDEHFILVTIVEKKPAPVTRRRKSDPKPKPKPKSAFTLLMEQEGLF